VLLQQGPRGLGVNFVVAYHEKVWGWGDSGEGLGQLEWQS
jgi:hypothetical protein